jgi:hypothetical protein
LIRTFALPPALAWRFTSPLPRPVFDPRRRDGVSFHEANGIAHVPLWAFLANSSPVAIAIAARLSSLAAIPIPIALPRPRFGFLLQRRMAVVILGLDVRNVEKAIAADREVDEGRLDGRLDVDDLALVNVARIALVAGAFHIQLLENTVLHNGNAAFFGLEHIDQHFFLHAVSFYDLRRGIGVDVRKEFRSSSL